LIKRNRLGVIRDPMQSRVKMGQQVFFAILISIIFHNVGIHNEGSLDDKIEEGASTYEYYS